MSDHPMHGLPAITVPYIDTSTARRDHDLGHGLTMRRLSVEVTRIVAEPGTLHVDLMVADRGTGRPQPLSFHHAMPWDPERVHEDPGDFWRYAVKDAFMHFFSHELDELLLVCGERRDPHAR